MSISVCGLVFCYNEEHIIGETIHYYLSQDIDLVVFDNLSSDRSVEIIKQYQVDYPDKILDIVNIETTGYEWKKILEYACNYMHNRLSNYRWIMLIDADSFYCSPVKSFSLQQFISRVNSKGFNIIEGKLCEFYPTEKDNSKIDLPTRRMQYCKIYFLHPQQKIFRYQNDIDFHSHFGHICIKKNPKVFPLKFLYLHYKWVSYEHGVKKIFTDRMPRFVERRNHARFHPQYLGMLPVKNDLIKKSSDLVKFTEQKLYLSELAFETLLFFTYFLQLVNNAFSRISRKSKLINSDIAESSKIIERKYSWRTEEFWVMNEEEIIQQHPYANGLPKNYHFLMTDFCNASCIFCNQDFHRMSKRQITLDNFTKTLSNIPETRGSKFIFSGGGEPLLCRDFYKIVNFVNQQAPWIPITIKSNGLLIGDHADELSKCKIDRLGMSVHGATMENNNLVLQAKNSRHDVFKGLERLNIELKKNNNTMKKIFYMVVSQVNIDELPMLVNQAEKLEVDEIMVMFSRYYPDRCYEKSVPPAMQNESLFYAPDKYDEVVSKSKTIAQNAGIFLRHEPLFGDKFTEQPCLQPWDTIVINWDGTIFPCTGGEVWFRDQVAENQYNFGNILQQHISDFWNNESYTKIRRTLQSGNKEDFVPECHNCHNTACIKGIKQENAHIIQATSENLLINISTG